MTAIIPARTKLAAFDWRRFHHHYGAAVYCVATSTVTSSDCELLHAQVLVG